MGSLPLHCIVHSERGPLFGACFVRAGALHMSRAGRGSPELPISPHPCPVSPGRLLYVPLSPGQHRLGGTALAQCFSQLGEQPPNLDSPEKLVRAFSITQGLLKGE